MAYWIEKTYPSEREEGDFTNLLLSPIRDERNADIYANMRRVQINDIIFHIDQDNNMLIGYSYVNSPYEEIFLGNKAFYTVNLKDYTEFNNPININQFLTNPNNNGELHRIRDTGQEKFYQLRDGNFYIKQGGYLTKLSDELRELLVNINIVDGTLNDNQIDEDIDNNTIYPEGREKYRLHKRKERSYKLIKDTKNAFKLNNDNQLFCQCCGFNFSERYGPIGENFIEGHHITPLNTLSNNHQSTIEDIILLCSNCHRMVHREPNLDIDLIRRSLN